MASNGQNITDAIHQYVEREMGKVYEEEKARLVERLETVREETIAKAGVKLAEMMSIEDLGRRVVITIDKREQP